MAAAGSESPRARRRSTTTLTTSSSLEPTVRVRDDRFNGKLCKFAGLDDSDDASMDWFCVRMREMLKSFRRADPAVRGVWVELPGGFFHGASWLARSHGFVCHHANTEAIVLNKWLPNERDDPNLMPPFAHTYVGVGAIVLRRSKGEAGVVVDASHAEVLGITEKWAFDTRDRPKFPGGYVDPNERLEDAVVREVREETGIHVRFRRIVAFKQSTTFLHGCSDLYFACLCEHIDVTEPLKRDPVEIATARWIPVDDFLAARDVYAMNKELLRAAIADIAATAGTVPPQYDAEPMPQTPSLAISGTPVTDSSRFAEDYGQGLACFPRLIRIPGPTKPFKYDLYLPGACRAAVESSHAAPSVVIADARAAATSPSSSSPLVSPRAAAAADPIITPDVTATSLAADDSPWRQWIGITAVGVVIAAGISFATGWAIGKQGAGGSEK